MEKAPPAHPVPEGIVPRWRVSEPFAESRVDVTSLRLSEWAGLKWSTLEAVERGIANIAMLHPRAAEANTVFAAVTLRAATAGSIRVRFGFSDRVAVFLNGVQLFRGNDTYRTRDYRFLGIA